MVDVARGAVSAAADPRTAALALACLADDFNAAHQGKSQHAVACQIAANTSGSELNGIASGVQHVPQADRVTPGHTERGPFSRRRLESTC